MSLHKAVIARHYIREENPFYVIPEIIKIGHPCIVDTRRTARMTLTSKIDLEQIDNVPMIFMIDTINRTSGMITVGILDIDEGEYKP